MSLTEVLVSSFLLSLSVLLSTSLFTQSVHTIDGAKTKDKRAAEVHSINENVRHQVSLCRKTDGPYGTVYNMDPSICGNNMAQILLDEMRIQTPNTLTAEGHKVLSHNDGWTTAVIYLPQSGWCP